MSCCICKFMLFVIIISSVWFFYLTRKVDLKKRYQCKYVVVTGATGGCGSELVARLVEQDMTVITVARNEKELQKLIDKHNKSVIPFKFDFSEDLLQFQPKFDQFLKDHDISASEIGMCYSNAGYGEYKAFHATELQHKQNFMKVNLDSHIAVADYFVKLFVKHRSPAKKSAIIFTSSACAHMPGRYFQLYHTAKNAISSLGNCLSSEYKQYHIDCLVIHPSAVSHTKFYQHKDIKVDGKKIPLVGDMENSIIAVTPQQVVNRMLTRVGKENVCQVGWAAVGAALINCLGRNFNSFAWSILNFNKNLIEEKK